MKVTRLDPPSWIFRGEGSSRGRGFPPIAKQSKTSCSRTGHAGYTGFGDLGESFKHDGDGRRYPRRRSLQVVTAQRKKLQNGRSVRPFRRKWSRTGCSAGCGR